MSRVRVPRDPGLFVHVLLRWCLAPLLIRCLSLSALLKVYTPRRQGPRHPARLQRIPRYCWLIRHWVPLGNDQVCLRRCLVLCYFLNRWGEPVAIRVGVQRTPAGQLVGHSWLTRPDGSPWRRDPQQPQFTEVAVLALDGVSGITLTRVPARDGC